MKIDPLLFEAFLRCPTKCYLLAHGEVPTGNAYADWIEGQKQAYRAVGIEKLKVRFANQQLIAGDLSTATLTSGSWRLALDVPIETPTLQSRLHAVERLPDLKNGSEEWIPIRLVFGNRPKSTDKLLLAFDALVLSQATGKTIAAGRIVCEEDYVAHRIKVSALVADVQKALATIAITISNSAPPELVLNRHCAECQFQARCRQKALELDELSLFSGMSPEERERHRRRGIFTVNQLSYTFRPRRRPKKAQPTRQPHYFSLQALAIRENKVYVNGNPELPHGQTEVFLDIEGLSSSGPFYLLGALIQRNGEEEFHSFWADSASDEPVIFTQFLQLVSDLPNLRVFHFGSYDAGALKLARVRLPESLQPKVDRVLQQSTNVLSVIYSHVYFPTYSNGLKEIGRFLNCERTTDHLSGLRSIMARKSWELDRNPETKASLILYNEEDCQALRQLCRFIDKVTSPLSTDVPGLGRAERILGDKADYQVTFAPKKYADANLEFVSKCAYFDYQREKVVFRTHPHLRLHEKRRVRVDPRKFRPNKIVILEKKHCPTCGSKRIRKEGLAPVFVVDLKFSGSGVRRFVTKISSWTYFCLKCRYPFSARGGRAGWVTLGRSLLVWCVHCNVLHCQTTGQITKNARDLFGIPLQQSSVIRAKHLLAEEFKPLYDEILNSLLHGTLLHADETQVRLLDHKGYVWVFASLDRCYFFYRPNREGAFLADLLKPFAGVLVSDFYGAYDSLSCAQQKCLLHFVRDIDDDLLKNPLDQELKTMAQEFGILLKDIVQTVDQHGLKKFWLHKHKKPVTKFLASIAGRKVSSELAAAYQDRFKKSGTKMFTFLDYDGIPWNNNSAEHAIKRFAKYRRAFDGFFTENSLRDYLVLASVFATCEYNNVNVLRFLLSGEKTLAGLLSMGRRRTGSSKVASQSAPTGEMSCDSRQSGESDQTAVAVEQAGVDISFTEISGKGTGLNR